MSFVRQNRPPARERPLAPEHRRADVPAALAGFRTLARDGFLIHVDPSRSSELAFALSVAAGLDGRPRRLDASFLYDAAGSRIFEKITAEPEYYLTRTEDGMLASAAPRLRALAGSDTLVELGSGTSTKTAHLLDAWCAAGPTTYVPIDVDLDALDAACTGLRARYLDRPGLVIEGVAARYERALAAMHGFAPPGHARTVVFLGSSLGNLGWRAHPEFCRSLAGALDAEDSFLVGLDLVKSPARLEAAYNDAAGWTARFTRNVFSRMNRELGTEIPQDAFAHVAFYDRERERIEIFAEATREVTLRIEALRRTFRVAPGERILTEVSHKFRAEAAIASIERCGFRSLWHDVGDGTFGLFLFRRAGGQDGGERRARRNGVVGARAELGPLEQMRSRTLEIVAPLDDTELRSQPSPIMSPIVWDLGHIAEFEAEWLLPPGDAERGGSPPRRVAAGGPLEDAGPPELGPSAPRGLYDALATPRARRGELPLPPVEGVGRRLREVRAAVQSRLDRLDRQNPQDPRDPKDRPERLEAPPRPAAERTSATRTARLEPRMALRLVLQHEAQHQETILQAIGLREELDYRPTFAELDELDEPARTDAAGGIVPVDESIFVPAGAFRMGTDDRLDAYDNERPAHEVHVAAFAIDRSPVTNQRFLAFMHDGGYARREVWSEPGWAFVQNTGARAPLHWRVGRGGWASVSFGRRVPLHPDAPVVHVSWFEADAFARWSGARLPTEAEWEKAAAWDPAVGTSRLFPWGDAPWESHLANLDQGRLEPATIGAYPEGRSAYGCLQMLGDVWEWTSSCFDGYPGFESFPYREYSEIFFGQTYRVLRGGSFATRAVVARNTFRNWDLPERRQIFAGFRCARPA